MSRLKLTILSLFLAGFVFCVFGTSSYAQLQGPTLGGPLKLSPLEPVDPSFEPDTYFYEVFRATPGGIVFILSGYQLGEKTTSYVLIGQLI